MPSALRIALPPSGPGRPDSPAWRACVLTAGTLLTLIGAAVLTACALGQPEYAQIDSTSPPLPAPAAIGLLIGGLGCVALARGRSRAAVAAGLLVGALAVALFAASGTGGGASLPASPPPAGTSFALLLAGVGLALAARAGTGPLRTRAAVALGALLLLLGPLAPLCVRAGLPPGATAGETVLGRFGAGLFGLALVACAFRRGLPAAAVGSALPAGIGLCGVAATLALWAWLSVEQDARVRRHVQFEVAHAHRTLRDRLQWHLTALNQYGGNRFRRDPRRVKEEVGLYIGQNPGCVGVAHVEPDLSANWVEYRQVAPTATLAEMGLSEAVAQGVQRGQTVVARPPRSLWRGAWMLAIFVPDREGTPNSGGVLALFRFQEFLGSILSENVAAGYALQVSDGPDTLFTRRLADGSRRRWAQSLPLPVPGATWRVEAQPTAEVLDSESLALPRLALIVGLATTALLALAVNLAQTAQRRARALEAEVGRRESAQTALRQSEEKYRTLIENLGQGIFLQDRDGRYVAANPQFCRAVGLAEEQIVGRSDADLFEPSRAAGYAEELRTVLAEGKGVESEEEREQGGRRSVVRRVLTPVHDAAGEAVGVLGICWDVTEQRMLESQVQQASKMDAIGQLAGGIAHDFNNLLTAISGNLELIIDGISEGDPCRGLAVDAQNAASRAASLTKRLLSFARRHQLDWVPTDLNGVVYEVVAILGRTIDPRVQIETRCGAEMGLVRADPAQLNQLLMNLCLNARDAIAGAGRITVETAPVEASELPRGSRLNPAACGYVRLTVSDTGCGMTEEVRARMYEPFFTTKEVGKGTGLGLAMVFATVRQHKGWIDCRSEVGRGTRFDVYLPRTAAAAPAARPDTATPLPAARGTVLVVDDEGMIRRLAGSALQSRGYRVLEAADGQEAIDIYAREGDRIDLVVLDLTMPVLSGHEAFRHLTRLNPRVRVLFASGYAAEQLTDFEKELMKGFLAKPYRPNDLLAAVAEALSRDTAGVPAENREEAREFAAVGS